MDAFYCQMRSPVTYKQNYHPANEFTAAKANVHLLFTIIPGCLGRLEGEETKINNKCNTHTTGFVHLERQSEPNENL